jgi:hypothetical protein
MNRVKCLAIAILLLVPVVSAPLKAVESGQYKYSLLSVKKLKLHPAEKIIGFKLRMKDAYIHSVPVAPPDWTVKISNGSNPEGPWRFAVTGFANHTSGAVKEDYFKDFAVIGQFQFIPGMSDWKSGFDLELEITLDLDSAERKVVLRAKNLALAPFKADKAF